MTTPPVKVLASQLYSVQPGQQDLAREQVRMETLVFYLKRRKTLSDPDNQCLRYETPEGNITLQEDDDLRNAISYARKAGRNYLSIHVKSQDELGQLTPPY